MYIPNIWFYFAPMKMTIKSIANKSKRTFTIRKYDEQGKLVVKYRTTPQNKDEFQSLDNHTQSDWQQWLNNCDEYFKVK